MVISSYEVGRELGVDAKTARRHITAAIDGGYLTNRETRARKPYILALKVLPPDPATDILPDPDSFIGRQRLRSRPRPSESGTLQEPAPGIRSSVSSGRQKPRRPTTTLRRR